MFGAIAVAIALLIVIPVGVIMTGGVVAAIISHFLRTDVDAHHVGSELVDLNG